MRQWVTSLQGRTNSLRWLVFVLKQSGSDNTEAMRWHTMQMTVGMLKSRPPTVGLKSLVMQIVQPSISADILKPLKLNWWLHGDLISLFRKLRQLPLLTSKSMVNSLKVIISLLLPSLNRHHKMISMLLQKPWRKIRKLRLQMVAKSLN